MAFLHSEPYKNNLVKRWANDVEFINQEGYEIPKYYIHKIGTEEFYSEAIDLPNAKRIEMGLQPFEYETTDIEIETEEETEINNPEEEFIQ